MPVDMLTVGALSTWEQPSRDVTLGCWAFDANVFHPEGFQLPHGHVYDVLPRGSVNVYVDTEENLAWAEISRADWAWTPRDDRVDYNAESPVPAWVRDAPRNHPRRGGEVQGAGRQFPLLVRRTITDAEAEALLDEIMPTVDLYPAPAHIASILRAGGWTPEQVRLLWWEVATEEDAAVIAAHLPHWWKLRGWLFKTRTHDAPEYGPPAAFLGELVAREVRADVAEVCLRAGKTDAAEIAALRPPSVPDHATRIYSGPLGSPYGAGGEPIFYVDPADARLALDRHVHMWLSPLEAEVGPHPLHISSVWQGDPAHLIVWSDGMLTRGIVSRPTVLRADGSGPDWQLVHREFEATQRLLKTVLDADNVDELHRDVWMAWRGADEVNTEVVDERTMIRAVAVDQTVERVLTRLRHTVRHADGTTDVLWENHVQIVLVDAAVVGSLSRQVKHRSHVVCVDARQADERWLGLDDGLPVVATVEEVAALAGRTREALAQALSRGQRAHSDALVRAVRTPGALRGRGDVPNRIWGIRGRTSWYDPRAVLTWLARRPGHGPGRGHRGVYAGA